MYKSAINKASQVSKSILIVVIKIYQQVISPWLGDRCRFYPSCSHYTVQAIRQRGVWRGCFLGGRRLLRCHPFNPGGYDPVPESHSNKKLKSE